MVLSDCFVITGSVCRNISWTFAEHTSKRNIIITFSRLHSLLFSAIAILFYIQELFMSTLRASRTILLLSSHIKSSPPKRFTFVTNLLSLRSSGIAQQAVIQATLEKDFYPGGIQLSYIYVFSVQCLKNNPNMEITNSYYQYVATHKRLRQFGAIGIYLTLQVSMKT